MTQKSTFKVWLSEADDEDMFAGVKSLGATAKSAFDATTKVLDTQRAKNKEEDEKDKKKKAEEDKKELHTDIQTFISNLFKLFPYHAGAGGPEDLMDKFESYDSAKDAFTAFKNLSEQTEKFRIELNRNLTRKKQLKSAEVQGIEKKAKSVVQTGKLPDSLIKFVKKEANFFNRLFEIDPSEFDLPADNFNRLLSSKLAATASGRIYDAALALNILMLYLADEFKAYAKTIGEVGRARKAEAPEEDKE